MKNLKQKTRAYALKNAIHHGGKAVQGAVVAGLFAEGLKPADMKKYGKDISEIIKEINKLSVEEQEKAYEGSKVSVHEREIREGLEELPGVRKGIVTRFSPSPSGALHIGHALTAALSIVYTNKYKGKFICRIEDTNPDNIYSKAYNLIKKDIEWLSKGKVKIVIQSERLEIYYKYANELINKSAAYVCTCSSNDFREFVKAKKNCPCRSKNVEENLEDWEKMLNKKGFGIGEAVLRFKTPKKEGGMENKNPAMRDFPLARINETSHPKQKKKYRVWPLMNLCVAVDDIEMKMTHIIRGKEHRDNAQRQKMIFEVLGKKYPWEAYLGRWHIEGLRLSASEITKDIEAGKYSGWSDKKLPTIQALIKRKYKPEAFWKIAEQRGLSEVDKVIAKEDFFELLDNFNK
jgi:glutamyl-tRNA synthetase